MDKFVSTFLRIITIEKLLILFLLLSLPMLFAPFITDDYFHLLMLSENPPLPIPNDGSLWGLFSFINNSPSAREYLMQQGVLPWWTADNFYFKFWRPLAEMTHYLDYVIAPGKPFIGHVQNAIWFILTSLIYLRIYKKLTNKENLALLAVSIFILNGHHAATIEWIANRNALMAAFFTGLSFYWHILYRENQRTAFCVLALISLALGLFSGESAIAMGGFLFAYAIFLDSKGKLRGFIALLPYAVLTILWYWKYKALGFGANGSAIHYVDPAAMPLEFLWVLLERVPVYIFSAFSIVPAETYPALQLFFPDKIQSLVLIFVIALIVVLLSIFYPLFRKNPLLQFSFFGGVLATIPFCSIINQDRLTFIPSFGFGFSIAIIIYQISVQQEKLWPQKVLNILVKVAVVILCVTHLILSPILLFGSSLFIQSSNKKIETYLLGVDNQFLENKKVVVLKGALTNSALLKPVRLLNGLNYPENVWFMSGNRGVLNITRENENTILIKRNIGFVEGFEESFREIKVNPFTLNEIIQLGDLKIIIKEINDRGQPISIQCVFAESISSSRYSFLTEIKGGGFKKISMPEINKSLVL